MFNMASLLAGAALTVLAMAAVPALAADTQKTVVLVHGAFADSSSWSKLVPLLESGGLKVVTVDNPLTSLADDVAATKTAIDAQNGPVILVGHSWGGVVISAAGNDDKVKALVFVAAFAVPPGVSVNALSAGQPAPPWQAELQPDAAGFLTLTDKGIATYFAQDLPPADIAAVATAQQKTFGGLFDETFAIPAYATKPSWYVVANQDGMIPSAAELAMANGIKATVTQIDGSHVIMLSQPEAVAKVIIAAANAI